MPLRPVYETVVPHNDPAEGLAPLADYLVRLVSTTMPLFELFGFFGTMVTFDEQADGRLLARVWPPFPRRYNHERWGEPEAVGGDRLPVRLRPLRRRDHPDPLLHPSCRPFRHVEERLHSIRSSTSTGTGGIEVDQFHMQESLIGRWDIDDYVDEETNVDQYKNVAFNACASALGSRRAPQHAAGARGVRRSLLSGDERRRGGRRPAHPADASKC